jgi:hypothetical protein
MPAPSRHRSRPLSQTVRRLAQAPPTPFIDGRKSVASRAHTNMRATTDGAEFLRSVNAGPSRHRSRLLSQTVRRLAQAPPTPFIDGRKSVASRAHANMRATTDGAEFLRSGNLPAPLRHRSRLLSQTVRRLAQAPPTPFRDGRKIGRVGPHQHAWNDRGGRNLEVRQPARAIAPSLSQTVRRLAQAPPTPFIDGRKSVASRAHANMRATTEGAEILRSGKRLPRHAIAPRHSLRPCAGSRKHRRPRLSFIDGRKSVASPAHTNMRATTEGAEFLRSGTSLPRRAITLGTLSDRAPARASTADPVSRWSKIGRFACPRQYACNDRRGRILEVRHQPAPSHTRSRLLSQTVRRLAQALPTPFIDGRKSVASHAHANMHATTDRAEILTSGTGLPGRAIALGLSRRPCAGSRKHRRPRLSMVENRSRRAPTPTCVQRPRGPKS